MTLECFNKNAKAAGKLKLTVPPNKKRINERAT